MYWSLDPSSLHPRSNRSQHYCPQPLESALLHSPLGQQPLLHRYLQLNHRRSTSHLGLSSSLLGYPLNPSHPYHPHSTRSQLHRQHLAHRRLADHLSSNLQRSHYQSRPLEQNQSQPSYYRCCHPHRPRHHLLPRSGSLQQRPPAHHHSLM